LVLVDERLLWFLKKVNKTLSELVADKTDFKAIIRDKKTTPKEKDFALNMLALQRLSIGANKNLDAAYLNQHIDS
jgi:hypothetical protein